MKQFIDVHCHLDLLEEIDSVIDKCKKKSVGIIVAQGTNVESNRKVLLLSEKYSEIKVALGIYPIDALKMSDLEIDREVEFIKRNKKKVYAIGEVGIDFKEDLDNWERQKNIFEKFVNLSIELDVPIIIHSRKAEEECIEILEKLKAKKVIMHCFSGKFKLVERIIKNKWYLSVPTSVIRSEQFQKIALETPIEQLFCETDSPYLHPDKEWPNIPSNVIRSYEKISEIKEISLEKVRDFIYDNYKKIFK